MEFFEGWSLMQYRNIGIVMLLLIACILWWLNTTGSKMKVKKGHTITEYKGYKIQRRDITGFTRVYDKYGKLVRTGHVSHPDDLAQYMDYYIRNKRLKDCPGDDDPLKL